MAIKIYEKFAPRANPADGDYPHGSIKNESIPGAKDGTPLDAVWANDYAGFDAALLAEAGITPSGSPDTALVSQRLSALKKINGRRLTTVAEIATGIFNDGEKLAVTDRSNGNFDIVTGTPNGADKLDAGGSNIAKLVDSTENDAAWYGMAVGGDITAALLASQENGTPLYMRAGTYIITAPVEIKTGFRSVGGRVTFLANGLPAGASAVSSSGEHDIIGLDIDCAGTSSMQNGFIQDLDFEPTRRLKLDIIARNVTNLDNTQGANGILMFLSSGSPVKKVKLWGKLEAHNITATANGIIGDTGGAAQGVFSSINGTGVVVDMIWDNPKASKIYPAEDGDGIHTFDGDLGNLDSKSVYIINSPDARDCAKRGVKIQSPNTTVNDMYVNLDLNSGVGGSALAFESLGVNTTLLNPRVKGKTNLTGDGSILASAANCTIINPQIDVAAGQNLLRFNAGATNHKVQGGAIKSTKNYGSNAFSMITVEGAASGVIEMDTVNVTTRTGSVIRYQGCSTRHSFILNGLGQAETLSNIAFSTVDADIHLWSYQGDYTGSIVDNTGEDGVHTFHALYGFTAGATVATCASNVRFTGVGKIQSTTNGILYTGSPAVGAEVSGSWEIRCTAGTGIGIDIGGGAMCKVTGAETIGFDSGIHINANFSGKCVVTNNIGRGTGTLVSSTGATNFIGRDNDLIA